MFVIFRKQGHACPVPALWQVTSWERAWFRVNMKTHHKAGVALMLTEEVRRQAENFPKAVQLARNRSGTVPAWLLHSHNPTPPTEPESAENTEGPDTKSSEIPLWEERQCWNFWENGHQCSGADHSGLILWMGETADSRNRLYKEYNKSSWSSWSRYGLTCLSLWVRGGWPSAPPDADPQTLRPRSTLSACFSSFFKHTPTSQLSSILRNASSQRQTCF